MSTTQQHVAEFVTAHNLEAPVAARLLDLAAEVGELAKEALKGTAYGRADFTPTAGWAFELGDCYFALLCLANSTGVDLEQSLEDAVEKYKTRLVASGEPGSGR